MSHFTYRLQPLLENKEEARQESEKELRRKESELESQTAKLLSLEQRLKELIEKRIQLRRELTNPGAEGVLSARQAQQRFEEIQALSLLVDDANAEVANQRSVVEKSQAKVEQAKKELKDATREVEVLKKHREKQ